MFTAHYSETQLVEVAAKAYRHACTNDKTFVIVGDFNCTVDWKAQKVVVSSESYNFDIFMHRSDFMPTVEHLGRK